jgi:hypothetical protein
LDDLAASDVVAGGDDHGMSLSERYSLQRCKYYCMLAPYSA